MGRPGGTDMMRRRLSLRAATASAGTAASIAGNAQSGTRALPVPAPAGGCGRAGAARVRRTFRRASCTCRYSSTTTTVRWRNRTASRSCPIVPNRGVITDRNGVVLAQSYSAYTLELTPAKIANLDATIDELAKIVDVQPRDRKRFRKLLDESKNFESMPLRTRLSGRGSRAVRGQSLPVSRRGNQGAPCSASIRTAKIARACRGLHRAHQRPRRRTHREMGRCRQLQGLRLHGEGRRGAVLRARAARHHGLRGSRGRRRRARRAHAVAHAAVVGQQPAAVDRHQAAGNRGGRIRRPARRAWSRSIPQLATSWRSSRRPAFDPNLFVDGIDSANWAALNDSPDKPMLNRPLRGAYPPGSTIKPYPGARRADVRQAHGHNRRSTIRASISCPAARIASATTSPAATARSTCTSRSSCRATRITTSLARRDRHRRHGALPVAAGVRP